MRNLKNFVEKLKAGNIECSSELHMRNEDIQNGSRRNVYPMLKKEQGKVCKLLIPKEIALDFNPFTGKEDEKYNPANKFRPVASPTTLALAVKRLADECAETKERLMAESGVSVWDTSDAENLTDVDKKVFKPYVQTQIFTIPTFNCKLKQITGGSEIPRSYVIHVSRDPVTGSVIGDMPLPLQANKFFAAVAREEVNDLQKRIDAKEVFYTEKQQKEEVRKIWDRRVLISSDMASNFVRCIELKTDRKFQIDSSIDLEGTTVQALSGMVRLSRLTKEIKASIEKYRNGDWAESDTCFDYYELDMSCPPNETTPMQIGLGTRYERPFKPIASGDGFEKFRQAFCNLLDKDENLEKIVWASTRIREYTESDNARFIASLEEEIDLDDKFITENVIKYNQDFITTIFPDSADFVIEAVNHGTSGREKGVSKETEKPEEQMIDLTDYGVDDLDEVVEE